jgi:hypothetical protein
MNTKICAQCGVEKPVSEFYKNSRSKDSLHSYCKKCNKEKAAAYRKTDKGKAALGRAIGKAQDRGYYRYGKGAIPILRQGAVKRGLSFDLTAESLENWWHSRPDNCFYYDINLDEYLEIRDFILSYKGRNFEINKFKRFYRSPKFQKIRWMTIDRIHNDKGYEIENIAKACWLCNSLKSDFFDGDQMRLIAPRIMAKLKIEIEKEKA